VQPGSATALRNHLALVDEAEVDHAPAANEQAQRVEPIHELGRRHTVYRRGSKLRKCGDHDASA